MLNSEVLEVGIGMAMLFFFMSLIATASCELVENVLKKRAADLKDGVKEFLKSFNAKDVDHACEAFYNHPLIASLYKNDYRGDKTTNLPSYIPRGQFAQAIIDLLRDGTLTTNLISPDWDDQRALRAVEQWYDGSMDRVAGWYKRRSGYRLMILGAAATLFLNVDAISVAKSLIHDKALREAVVQRAETVASPGATPEQTVQNLSKSLKEVGYPIGWRWVGGLPYPEPMVCEARADQKAESALDCGNWIVAVGARIPGWIITILAVMLGAPFWFDVLNKLMVIRSTVKPKEKSPDEGSQDGPNTNPAGATPRSIDNAALSNDGNEADADLAASMAVTNDAFVPHEWKVPQKEGLI